MIYIYDIYIYIYIYVCIYVYIYIYIYMCVFSGLENFVPLSRRVSPPNMVKGSILYWVMWKMGTDFKTVFGSSPGRPFACNTY